MRREVHTNGKSRAFINDSPVSLSILKEVAIQLIDIHSQHQNLLIGKDHFQLDVVDTVVGQPVLLGSFQTAYHQYKSLQAELKTLKEELERSKSEEDYLRFQLDQLQQAGLKPGELEDLNAESSLLTHVEEIKAGLGKLHSLLDDELSGGTDKPASIPHGSRKPKASLRTPFRTRRKDAQRLHRPEGFDS